VRGFNAAGAASPGPPRCRFLPDQEPEWDGEGEGSPAPNPSRFGLSIPHAWKRLFCTGEECPAPPPSRGGLSIPHARKRLLCTREAPSFSFALTPGRPSGGRHGGGPRREDQLWPLGRNGEEIELTFSLSISSTTIT
jgi:hypothetical protein